MPTKKTQDAIETTRDRELTISRLLNASRELVWEVWTNPDHIRNWWGPNGFTNTITKMDLQPGGTWELVMHGPDGRDYKNKSIYRELVRFEKIVYDHVSVPKFQFTASFEKKGEKTLLTIQMLFESSEKKEEVVKVFKADTGLQENINRLEDYLESVSGINEINSQSIHAPAPLVLERKYNVPVEKLWKAITDKDQMRQWYFDLAEFKAEIGFEFQFEGKGSKGERYLHLCRITDIVPLKKIQYTWRYDGLEGSSVLTWELFPEKDHTKLVLTHEGLDSFRANGADFMKESFQSGWTYFLDEALKNFFQAVERS